MGAGSGPPLPDGVERVVHVLDEGRALVCDATWRGALAVVEQGSVELVAPLGGRLVLARGGSFCVELTGPVVLRRSGEGPAVVATVRRRRAARGADVDDPTGP